MSDIVRRLRDQRGIAPGWRSLEHNPLCTEAADEIERLRSQLVKGDILWCCHVRGPDDVYAAPDYLTALAWSDALNEMNWKANSKLNIADPASFQECLIKAVPAPWPHSPESHAEDLPKSIAGFTAPDCAETGEDHPA